MTEPRILSVCWLPREQLKEKPDRITITDEQLNEITNEDEVDDDEAESGLESDQNETDGEGEEKEEKEEEIKTELEENLNDLKINNRPDLAEDDAKIWDEYNLDDYDDEDDDLPLKIGSLVAQGNNEDGYDPIIGDDSDEEEDITLKKTDHILLAGTDGNDGTASVEVRIFNTNEEYYVRNDISLSGPPLCLCYVHTEIGEELEEDKNTKTEYSANFVAIGSITNEIQIWDLDVIDSPGPEYTFTGHKKGSSVVSISWDGDRVLASGGTDGRVLLWCLNTGTKIALGKQSDIAINQVVFSTSSRIITGDAEGICRIYDKSSIGWRCIKELNVGHEIEKICENSNLIAIGTSKGVILLIAQSSLQMTARWKAYQPEQPITALEFKSNDYLFSSGHEASCDLIVWNISQHKIGGKEAQIPLAQYRRRRHKQSGRTFCAVLNPTAESDLVLVGGESGGPQVLKLSQRSKKVTDDDSDSEDEEEEQGEDTEGVDGIKEDEWETDSGSSDGEMIIDDEA